MTDGPSVPAVPTDEAAACECSGDDEFCALCWPDAMADRVFCRNCGRAIFPSPTTSMFGWAHVSTHNGACPISFAQPKDTP